MPSQSFEDFLGPVLEHNGYRRDPKISRSGSIVYDHSSGRSWVIALESHANSETQGRNVETDIGSNSSADSLDAFFEEIQEQLKSMPFTSIRRILVPTGGMAQIPKWFLDWCKEKFIDIHWVDPETDSQRIKEIVDSFVRDTMAIVDEFKKGADKGGIPTDI